ncbi:Kinesin-associated protein 3-like, partial [Globisporangium splendens]
MSSSSRVFKSSSAVSSSSKGDARVEKLRKVIARADELDSYMEKLYGGDAEPKIDGAKCLLSRALNDDHKKSNDFSLTMMRIFWCFSNFLQLHPILPNYRIGAIMLKIVEFEIRRHGLRVAEEKTMEAVAVGDEEALVKLEREKKRMKKQDQLLGVLLEIESFIPPLDRSPHRS